MKRNANHTYSLYGFTVSVPFRCPMLEPALEGAPTDVEVVEGPVPRSLTAPVAEGPNWQAAPGIFLMRGGRRGGRFLVESGQRITLERNLCSDDEMLGGLLMNAVMAAFLRQRGKLVLHANVVTTPRGAVAISGATGAGKSTTQARLMIQGCKMVTDDVTVLSARAGEKIMVQPGVTKMNLCEDAAIRLGHDVSRLKRNPMRSIKVIVPVSSADTLAEPVPLKEIYYIESYAGKELVIHHLQGAEKFAALQDCIYGPLFPQEHDGLFSLIGTLVRQVKMTKVLRPARGCSVNAVAEAILHG